MSGPPRLTYSYTAIEQFQTCPRQFEAQRVLKVIKNAETFERSSGTDGHTAIENAFKYNAPITPEHAQHQWMVNWGYHQPWTKIYTEVPLAMDRDWNPLPLGMNGEIPWGRTHTFAKLDYLAHDEHQQLLTYADWKFGKSNKPKPAQIEYGLLLGMLAVPSIQVGQGFLVFSDHTIPPPVILRRADLPRTQAIWMARINEIEEAAANKHFPAKPSGLCFGWCNYTQCEHWKPKKVK